MMIINEKELLEDTAEMITHYKDISFEDAKKWVCENTWFMEAIVSEMYEAQSNYIADYINEVGK